MNKKRDFFDILSSQLVASTGGIIAGTLLAIFTDQLSIIPGLFIILPGFLELKEVIAGSLASRLGSELHTHKIKTDGKSKLIKENKMASFILILFVSSLLGVLAYLLTYFLFKQNNPNLLFLPIIAIFVSSLALFPLTIKLTLWLYKHHHDPDSVMGPYISSIGDIECILSLLVAIIILT